MPASTATRIGVSTMMVNGVPRWPIFDALRGGRPSCDIPKKVL